MSKVRVCLTVIVALIAASCSSTPEGPTIQIGGDGWVAVPESVTAGGGSFEVTVENDTASPQSFAVVALCTNAEATQREGGNDPAALPMTDGLLDLSRDGLCGDPEQSGLALFSVVHGDYEHREGEGVVPGPLTPTIVEPGEETTVKIGGSKGGGEPGTYVILSWEPGGYEAGDYAVFTITG